MFTTGGSLLGHSILSSGCYSSMEATLHFKKGESHLEYTSTCYLMGFWLECNNRLFQDKWDGSQSIWASVVRLTFFGYLIVKKCSLLTILYLTSQCYSHLEKALLIVTPFSLSNFILLIKKIKINKKLM